MELGLVTGEIFSVSFGVAGDVVAAVEQDKTSRRRGTAGHKTNVTIKR